MVPNYKTTQLQGITDLTVVARVKPGLVPDAFETETMVERLRRVLAVLDLVRKASRESVEQPSAIADSVGRFRGIHFFRFGLQAPPPQAGREPPAADGWKLYLNVTFDGGWEPYMRIIYKPLGTLLDLIYCHCEEYPHAYRCSFDEYMTWVRDNEVPGNFFYADSAGSVADRAYLTELERLQRSAGGHPDADSRLTALGLPPQPPTAAPGPVAAMSSIRVLKALAQLRPLFRPSAPAQDPSNQEGFLLRFTQDLLSDLRQWVAQGLFDPGQRFDAMRPLFEAERPWLMTQLTQRSKPPERLVFRPAAVQAGIAGPYPKTVVHGALVLLRITDVTAATAWLNGLTVSDGTMPPPADGIYRNVAITFAGLRQLGVPQERLATLPREFIEGMEQRAGILGDLRGNHPQQWQRPASNWPPGGGSVPRPAVELSAVHLLLQLRTDARPGDALEPNTLLLQRLVADIQGWALPSHGVRVLHAQPMARNPPPAPGAEPLGHFGFVDGISQPTLDAAGTPRTYWDDGVKAGELFLGYGNDREDGPRPPPPGQSDDVLLDNGSFLVVRKLRQDVPAFDKVVDDHLLQGATGAPSGTERERVRAKLMGRHSDGTPLVLARGPGDNDFDYRQDAEGRQCPMQSHVRRANPRAPLPQQMPPRLSRRGMSYSEPSGKRGLVFMAYNASIAEQFEVIQRWLAGGNSSGLSSAQDDPFLGVPQIGERRSYRYLDDNGKVHRVDLGSAPLVALEWGLYAFVPSIAALKALPVPALASPKKPPAAPPGTPAQPPDEILPATGQPWRQRFEDTNTRDAAWRWVRDDQGGAFAADAYGVVVGCPAKVKAVLQDRGEQYSVSGYGIRMGRSIGLGFLGQDDVGAHAGHAENAPAVNAAIEREIDKTIAFDAAVTTARLVIDALIGAPRRGVVPFSDLGSAVVTGLCRRWFGLPDGKLLPDGTVQPAAALMAGPGRNDDPKSPPLCPGHLLTTSRYVFTPWPSETVSAIAQPQGKAVLAAFHQLLEQWSLGTRKLTPLVQAIVDACGGPGGDRNLQARTAAGVMLGFPATVLGNLITVLRTWTAQRELWALQTALFAALPPDADPRTMDPPALWTVAEPVLGAALLATMRRAPVPYAVWRTAAQDSKDLPAKAGDRIIIGLGSAVADGGDAMLMFGGSRTVGDPLHTPHACPGYGMAMGVMQGIVAALLAAGELRPDASPLQVTLVA